jgi:hypothetical protein
MSEAVVEEDDDDDDDDDESEIEDEGVYMHRTAKDRLPGSFPGFSDQS